MHPFLFIAGLIMMVIYATFLSAAVVAKRIFHRFPMWRLGLICAILIFTIGVFYQTTRFGGVCSYLGVFIVLLLPPCALLLLRREAKGGEWHNAHICLAIASFLNLIILAGTICVAVQSIVASLGCSAFGFW